ncbi:MAG: dockerin type I repeat-containing protein [Clostridia bacterium]|nr:dockerin type I repeat-containing protein [Clostridia bacterium]
MNKSFLAIIATLIILALGSLSLSAAVFPLFSAWGRDLRAKSFVTEGSLRITDINAGYSFTIAHDKTTARTRADFAWMPSEFFGEAFSKATLYNADNNIYAVLEEVVKPIFLGAFESQYTFFDVDYLPYFDIIKKNIAKVVSNAQKETKIAPLSLYKTDINTTATTYTFGTQLLVTTVAEMLKAVEDDVFVKELLYEICFNQLYLLERIDGMPEYDPSKDFSVYMKEIEDYKEKFKTEKFKTLADDILAWLYDIEASLSYTQYRTGGILGVGSALVAQEVWISTYGERGVGAFVKHASNGYEFDYELTINFRDRPDIGQKLTLAVCRVNTNDGDDYEIIGSLSTGIGKMLRLEGTQKLTPQHEEGELKFLVLYEPASDHYGEEDEALFRADINYQADKTADGYETSVEITLTTPWDPDFLLTLALELTTKISDSVTIDLPDFSNTYDISSWEDIDEIIYQLGLPWSYLPPIYYPPMSKLADVNGDDAVNINDILLVRDVIFDKMDDSFNNYEIWQLRRRADVNRDGSINIQDITIIRDIIFDM